MYTYKVYFHKVAEKIEANYHLYQDGFLRFYKGDIDKEQLELVAEFDEGKIVGWTREGTQKNKNILGFTMQGGKTDVEET